MRIFAKLNRISQNATPIVIKREVRFIFESATVNLLKGQKMPFKLKECNEVSSN